MKVQYGQVCIMLLIMKSTIAVRVMYISVRWVLNHHHFGIALKLNKMKQILVFKTSVTSTEDAASVEPLLNQLLPGSQWNFDLQDWENILRVESEKYAASEVVNALNTAGYYCEELPD